MIESEFPDTSRLYIANPASSGEIARINPSAIQINNPETRALVVKVNFDGNVEFGPDVTPDEAARQMWEAVARYSKQHTQNTQAAAIRAAIEAAAKVCQAKHDFAVSYVAEQPNGQRLAGFIRALSVEQIMKDVG